MNLIEVVVWSTLLVSTLLFIYLFIFRDCLFVLHERTEFSKYTMKLTFRIYPNNTFFGGNFRPLLCWYDRIFMYGIG